MAGQGRLILKGGAGHQHKRVTIVSNDPDHSRLTLSLIGEAVAEVAALGAAHGIVMAMENHGPFNGNSKKVLNRLGRSSP